MGVYYKIANLDKREFIDPDVVGNLLGSTFGYRDGVKLSQFISVRCLTPNVLMHALLGRWSGDRVRLIGDTADEGPCGEDEEWTDVTEEFCDNLREFEATP